MPRFKASFFGKVDSKVAYNINASVHNAYSIPASIGASWRGMQQQHNLNMGTTTMHVSAHVQVACCCCIPLQLAPMDASARSP